MSSSRANSRKRPTYGSSGPTARSTHSRRASSSASSANRSTDAGFHNSGARQTLVPGPLRSGQNEVYPTFHISGKSARSAPIAFARRQNSTPFTRLASWSNPREFIWSKATRKVVTRVFPFRATTTDRRGDRRCAHAPNSATRRVGKRAHRRAPLRRSPRMPRSSRPQVLRHVLDHGECFGEIVRGVGEGETGVAGGALASVAVEVDAAVDAAEDEAAVQLVVVTEGVGPCADWFADAEVETEAGAHPLNADGESGAVEDRLEIAVEGVTGGIEAVVDTGLPQFGEGCQGGEHAREEAGIGAAVGDGTGRRQLEHEVGAAGDGGEGQTVGERFGVGRQVGDDAVLGLDTAKVGAEPGEDLVEEEDDTVPGRPLAQEFEETGRGRDAAGIVMDRLAAHGGQFGAVTGNRPLEGVDVVPGDHHDVVGHALRDTAGGGDDRALGGGRIGTAEEPGFGQTVEVAVELEEFGAAGRLTGDA